MPNVAVNASLLDQASQIQKAAKLIQMGAKLSILEELTDLPRERLIRLYREVSGKNPVRGQLPLSVEWFLSGTARLHASIFMNIYSFMKRNTQLGQLDILIKCYTLYMEEFCRSESSIISAAESMELSICRAWVLIKHLESGSIKKTPCICCGGSFVAHQYSLLNDFECSLCRPPARLGKRLSGVRQEVGRSESLSSKIKSAQDEMLSWTEERKNNCRLEGKGSERGF